MKVGVPKEIKNNESRVGLTPESVKILTDQNNKVFIQEEQALALVLMIVIMK